MATLFISLLLLLYVPDMTQEAKYHKSERAALKKRASTLCTLASPDIIYTESGTHLNVSTGDFDPGDGEKYWVGYVKTFDAFQYRGCAWATDIDCDKQANVIADPGTCYSFCGTAYGHIGLSGNSCFCISTLNTVQTYLREDGCGMSCSSQPHVLCGGEHGEVSIYQKVEYYPNGNEKSVERGYFCLSLEPGSDNQAWANCDNNLRYFCETDTSVPDYKFQHYIYEEWSRIMEKCLEDGDLPASRATDNPYIVGTNLWLGVIRSHVIMPQSVTTDGTYQGYIQSRGGTLVLEFEEITEKLEAMCVTESTEETTELGTTYSITSTDTTITVEPLSSKSTTSQSTEATTTSKFLNKQNSKTHTVSLAVVLPLVLIVIAVVAVVFCIFKRRKIGCYKNLEARTDVNDQVGYESNPKTNGNYFILEPMSGDGNTEQQQSEIYQYDTPDGPSEKHAAKNADSLYNRLDADDMYDHTTDKRSQVNESCNVYSKTEPIVNRDFDDTYDHSTHAGKQVNVTDNVYNRLEAGGIYDHTGRNESHTFETEHVYSKPESDDVYNSIDGTEVRNLKTDNVYDTAKLRDA